MKVFDICSKDTYTKDGQEKAKWYKCGEMRVADDGKQFIKMFSTPKETYYVFEQKKIEKPVSSEWSE